MLKIAQVWILRRLDEVGTSLPALTILIRVWMGDDLGYSVLCSFG